MKPLLVILDNYDSFTYNLYQVCATHWKDEIRVVRNDQIRVEDLLQWEPSGLIISPGPKSPNDAGISLALIEKAAPLMPLLGVCLGMQAIAQVFGGRVILAPRVVHGRSTPATHTGGVLFEGVPSPFQAGRYHSLIVERASLPECLIADSWSQQDELMALHHASYLCFGLQFHPESILTPDGEIMVHNFLEIVKGTS